MYLPRALIDSDPIAFYRCPVALALPFNGSDHCRFSVKPFIIHHLESPSFVLEFDDDGHFYSA